MYPYPFFNFIFWLLLLIILWLRLETYNYEQSSIKDKSQISIQSYVLRHPYQEDGFQIIQISGYKFKTLIYPKYYLGDYIKIKFDASKSSRYIYFPEIIKIPAETNYVITLLAHFRDFLVSRTKTLLPQPYGGLLLGFVIGYQQDLPPEFNDLLISTGLVHLVVFSGSNVSFITEKSFPRFYRYKKFGYFLFSNLILGIIIILVGLEAPVIRAVCVCFIQNVAKIFGVNASSLVCLFYSFLVMVYINPSYLMQLSFQLSFISSLIVILIAGITKFIANDFVKGIFDNALAVLFLYPVVSYYFGTFSIKSLFTNLIASIVIPYILAWGFVYILFPNIVLEIGLLVLIDFFIFISTSFNKLEGFSWEYAISLRDLLILYGFLLCGYAFFKVKISGRFISYE